MPAYNSQGFWRSIHADFSAIRLYISTQVIEATISFFRDTTPS